MQRVAECANKQTIYICYCCKKADNLHDTLTLTPKKSAHFEPPFMNPDSLTKQPPNAFIGI